MPHRRLTIAILSSTITLFSAGALWFTAVNGEPVPAEAFPSSDQPAALANATSPSSLPEVIAHERYTDAEFGFSFEYPADLEIEVLDDSSAGHVILGTRPTGDAALIVNVSPLDEPLTPDLLYANVYPAELTAPIEEFTTLSGMPAFTFDRSTAPLGPSRGALFVHNSHLYHVAMSVELEASWRHLLDTWRFAAPSSL